MASVDNEEKIEEYKNDFKKYSYPIHPVVNTRPINVKGKPYRMIGQIMLSVPFFTNFKIINDEGTEANPSIRKKVHALISKLEITGHLTSLKNYLMNQKEAGYINDTNNLTQTFLDKYGKSLNNLIEEADGVLSLFNKMEALASELGTLEELSSEQFDLFLKAWDSFWEIYEQRMHLLFTFRSFVIEEHAVHLLEETTLNDLFNESQLLDQLYTESMSTETPLFTSIEDLIQLNLELGYVKENNDTESSILSRGENFARKSLAAVAKFFLLFLIPLGILLSIFGVISFYLLLFIGVITLILYLSKMTETVQLSQTISKRIKEKRADELSTQPIISTKYPAAYKLYENQLKEGDKGFSFATVFISPSRYILGFGIGILIMGLGIANSGAESVKYAPGYFTVGLLLIILSQLLQRTKVLERKMKLDKDALILGKRNYPLMNVEYIKVNKKGTKLKLKVNFNNRPMKLAILEKNRSEVIMQLKEWCKLKEISFIE